MQDRRTITKIDREAVAALLRQGLSGVQIATRLRCAPNSITVIKRELGMAIKPRKPSAEWKGQRKAKRPALHVPRENKKYSTERDHLALQIAEWPAGIHFEDAVVGREPMFRGTPPSFGTSLIGNGSAMSADKLGFV